MNAQLPDRPFTTIQPSDARATSQPVTLRGLKTRDGHFLYAVNESPWPVRVELEIKGSTSTRAISLTSRKLPPLQAIGPKLVWKLQLAPYEVLAGRLTSPNATISDWHAQLPQRAMTDLRDRIHEVRARASSLQNPPPLELLSNAGFESKQQGPFFTASIAV